MKLRGPKSASRILSINLVVNAHHSGTILLITPIEINETSDLSHLIPPLYTYQN